jgi:phosphate/phosphite/phosphonate ABC transporter binding protein
MSMKIQNWRPFVTGALLFGCILSGNAAGQTAARLETATLSLGIISETHQKEIQAHYRDFVDYVARKLSSASAVEGRVVVVATPPDLAKLLEQKTVDFYMESPYSTYIINNVHGAAKLLLRRWQRGKAEYQSLIFTRRNSGINRLQDLRGKIIGFESPESTSGYFLPKLYLLRNGFKLLERAKIEAPTSPEEIGYLFAQSQQNLVELVLTNRLAAGAFSDDDYAGLDEQRKSDITVVAETERLPRHLLSVQKNMAPALAERLAEILRSMAEDEEGRRILQRTGNTTKFDLLPEGEDGMRRRLLETFYSPDKK